MNGNEFLYCTPTVFVVGKEYEILINLKAFGICFVKIGEALYYEENSGVLPSERTVVKIRVPQGVLDAAKGYEVVFREDNERKSYWSTFLPPKSAKFSFKPLEKTADIRIYHLADVHYGFEGAKQTAAYWGEETDLFIMNGDIGEVETVQNYLEVCAFAGEVSGGSVPVLFVRGNHDTRGRLSELFTTYFPCQGKDTFYTFEVGCICGVVLDCGEDKLDASKEYDSSEDTPVEYLGLNRFHAYRRRQLEFLKGVQLDSGKIPLVVSHVCPAMTTTKPGGQFDIDRDVYTAWCAELDRIAPAFMLCGHYHIAFVMRPGDGRSLIPHTYPVVVGSKRSSGVYWGAAILLNREGAEVLFTDGEQNVLEKHELDFQK